MKLSSARAAIAQLRLDIELAVPVVLLAMALLVAGDLTLRRVSLPVADPAELRGAFSLLVLACLAASLPLILVGRDRPQLFLALPMGLRRIWLSKLVVSLVAMVPPTIVATTFAGGAWGKMAGTLLTGLGATYVALAALGLTASLYSQRPMTSLGLVMGWIVTAFGSAFALAGGVETGAAILCLVSVAALTALSLSFAGTIFTERDRPWRLRVLSFAFLLLLPALSWLNLRTVRVLGPTGHFSSGLNAPHDGIGLVSQSLLFPRLVELVSVDETFTLRRHGVVLPRQQDRHSARWAFLPERGVLLREDKATGDLEEVALSGGRRRLVGRAGRVAIDWADRITMSVAIASATANGSRVRLTRLDTEQPPVDLDLDAERTRIFLNTASSVGFHRLDADRTFAWALGDARGAIVLDEGDRTTPFPVLEAAGLKGFHAFLGGWTVAASGQGRTRNSVTLASVDRDFLARTWLGCHSHVHAAVAPDRFGLSCDGRVEVIDASGASPVAVSEETQVGRDWQWHFVKDGAMHCRLDPDRALFPMPSMQQGTTPVAWPEGSRGGVWWSEDGDFFWFHLPRRLFVWHLPSGRSLDLTQGDPLWEVVGPEGVEWIDFDEPSGPFRLAWTARGGIVAASRHPEDDAWTWVDSKDVPIEWHVEPSTGEPVRP